MLYLYALCNVITQSGGIPPLLGSPAFAVPSSSSVSAPIASRLLWGHVYRCAPVNGHTQDSAVPPTAPLPSIWLAAATVSYGYWKREELHSAGSIGKYLTTYTGKYLRGKLVL